MDSSQRVVACETAGQKEQTSILALAFVFAFASTDRSQLLKLFQKEFNEKKGVLSMTMISQIILIGSLTMATSALAATDLSADILDATGKKVGLVKVTEDQQGLKLALELKGAQPGVHGMHFHQKGKCEGPDFKSAGDHFNPTGKQHGTQNPNGPHLGDLPNLTIPQNGELKTEILVAGLTMGQKTNQSIVTKDGTALVIHAKADDGKTDPSGNSGDRIYCAVVSKPQVKASVK